MRCAGSVRRLLRAQARVQAKGCVSPPSWRLPRRDKSFVFNESRSRGPPTLGPGLGCTRFPPHWSSPVAQGQGAGVYIHSPANIPHGEIQTALSSSVFALLSIIHIKKDLYLPLVRVYGLCSDGFSSVSKLMKIIKRERYFYIRSENNKSGKR